MLFPTEGGGDLRISGISDHKHLFCDLYWITVLWSVLWSVLFCDLCWITVFLWNLFQLTTLIKRGVWLQPQEVVTKVSSQCCGGSPCGSQNKHPYWAQLWQCGWWMAKKWGSLHRPAWKMCLIIVPIIRLIWKKIKWQCKAHS